MAFDEQAVLEPRLDCRCTRYFGGSGGGGDLEPSGSWYSCSSHTWGHKLSLKWEIVAVLVES